MNYGIALKKIKEGLLSKDKFCNTLTNHTIND